MADRHDLETHIKLTSDTQAGEKARDVIKDVGDEAQKSASKAESAGKRSGSAFTSLGTCIQKATRAIGFLNAAIAGFGAIEVVRKLVSVYQLVHEWITRSKNEAEELNRKIQDAKNAAAIESARASYERLKKEISETIVSSSVHSFPRHAHRDFKKPHLRTIRPNLQKRPLRKLRQLARVDVRHLDPPPAQRRTLDRRIAPLPRFRDGIKRIDHSGLPSRTQGDDPRAHALILVDHQNGGRNLQHPRHRGARHQLQLTELVVVRLHPPRLRMSAQSRTIRQADNNKRGIG